jgi:hypothetical protein
MWAVNSNVCPKCRGPIRPIRPLKITGALGTPYPGTYHFGGFKEKYLKYKQKYIDLKKSI